MDLQQVNEVAVKEAKKLGADDAVAICARGADGMIRFANNSVTTVNYLNETELTVYLAKDKRRAIASTSNMEPESVRKFVQDLYGTAKGLPEAEYVPLPRKATKHSPSPLGYDKSMEGAGDELPRLAKRAISASTAAGSKRSAGVIDAGTVEYSLLASNGTSGTDKRSSITLNIRSFAERDASGHGLSCSSTLAGLDPEEAGTRAGQDAKKMEEASEPEAGKYTVLLSPTVASNLIETVGSSASAFSVEAGLSCLAEKVGKKVAADQFTLTDHGTVKGGLGGRVFDDEGVETGSTAIIEKGTLKGYLHNLTTAEKWKTESTGNAGFVTPHPWNLEVSAGDSSYDEMVGEMEKGIILTSNWYTRFKNYRAGEFSTVPRDGAYLVEGGKISRPLKGMRAGDDLLRMLSSVRLASRDREWIQWWEVDTPTLCPWVMVDGMTITRAYG